MPVAGTVSQVPLSKAERSQRDTQRQGYLGEGPLDTDAAASGGMLSSPPFVIGGPPAPDASDPGEVVVLGASSGMPLGAAGVGSQAAGTSANTGENHGAVVGDVATGHGGSSRGGGGGQGGATSGDLGGSRAWGVRLAEWTNDREVSFCEFNCMTAAACFFQCPEDVALGLTAFKSIPLSRFRTSDLFEICMEQMGCNASPPVTFFPVPLTDCALNADIQTILQAYVPQLDRGTLVDAFQQCSDSPKFSIDGSTTHGFCAPGCRFGQAGNFVCEAACFVDKCNYDFGDCCEFVWHEFYNEGEYYCPSNTSHPVQPEGQLFHFGFRVPDMESAPFGLIYNETAGNLTANSLPPEPTGISTTEDLRWRMVGVTNRIIGGILIKQQRTPVQEAPLGERFRWLFNLGFDRAGRAKPFGANPHFLRESALFVPTLVNRTAEFFTRDQVSDQQVPFVFFPVSHGGRDIFPVFVDMSASQPEALSLLKYIKEAFYLDAATEEVEVEFVTYNGVLEYFGMLVVRFRRQPGGVIAITSTVQTFSLDMYNTPAERVRGVGEVLLVLMVLAGTFFELQQVLACAANRGIYHYLADIANLIDLASISLFYVCIALWARFLVKYHGPFNIWLSYAPYRSVFESDEERLAKTLEFSHEGADMQQLLETFETVKDISSSIELYSFLTALNLLMMMMRVLKLTDFQPRLGIITHTLARALNDIAHYLLVAGVMFVCFAIMAHICFGTALGEFSTLLDSFNTCFLMVVGEVNINEKLMDLHGLQLTVAWIFFWLYTIIMYFILINFFIAFIIDAFSEHMSSGARSSATVAQDMHDVLRDAARQCWAAITCNGGHARSDASVAAKLNALAVLSKGQRGKARAASSPAGSQFYNSITRKEGASPTAESGNLSTVVEDVDIDNHTSSSKENSANDEDGFVEPDDVSKAGRRIKKLALARIGEDTVVSDGPLDDLTGHGKVKGAGPEVHPGQGVLGVRVDTLDAPQPTTGQASASSRILSKFLPGVWRTRSSWGNVRPQQGKQKHCLRAGEPQLVINGCTFDEEEVARLLLRGMQAASLSSGGGGHAVRHLDSTEGDGDLAARHLRAKARKVLFGSPRAAKAGQGKRPWGHGSGIDAGRGGVRQRRAEKVGSNMGRPAGAAEVKEGMDLERSLDWEGFTGTSPAFSGEFARDREGSSPSYHELVAEISRHAIWRFGTNKIDEVGGAECTTVGLEEDTGGEMGADMSDIPKSHEGLAPVAEPAMPENPTVQIAQMVGGLQAQVVEMAARLSAVLSRLAPPGEEQRQLEGVSLHAVAPRDPAPGDNWVHGDGVGHGHVMPPSGASRHEDQPDQVV
eukprot:jgi/Mesvir1/29148/Mv18440-RA.2